VDGIWGPWGSWSSCNSQDGKKKRTRKCNNPAPANGGKPCPGSSTEEINCAGSIHWSFCTRAKPCDLGFGDCDRDSECKGDLVCGTDNCRDFNSQDHPKADCCMKKAGCKCGIERKSKIVGGSETEPGNFPWMAVSRIKGSQNIGGCGATLIASRWAITAAHCHYERDYNNDKCIYNRPTLSLTFGVHDLNDLNDKRKEVKVAKIINHPQYNCFNERNDIALLKLAEEIDLTSYTPACLSVSGTDYTGQVGLAIGWGFTDACDPYLSPTLQEVNVKIVSDQTCEKAKGNYKIYDHDNNVCKSGYGSYAGNIFDEMLCAGSQGKDACQGDSGGPLTVDTSGQHTLVGVTSWGLGCAANGFYGVYTEVANKKIRAWIDQTIADNGGATFCTG